MDPVVSRPLQSIGPAATSLTAINLQNALPLQLLQNWELRNSFPKAIPAPLPALDGLSLRTLLLLQSSVSRPPTETERGVSTRYLNTLYLNRAPILKQIFESLTHPLRNLSERIQRSTSSNYQQQQLRGLALDQLEQPWLLHTVRELTMPRSHPIESATNARSDTNHQAFSTASPAPTTSNPTGPARIREKGITLLRRMLPYFWDLRRNRSKLTAQPHPLSRVPRWKQLLKQLESLLGRIRAGLSA